jgi:hypothetical protein
MVRVLFRYILLVSNVRECKYRFFVNNGVCLFDIVCVCLAVC